MIEKSIFGKLPCKLSSDVTVKNVRHHNKASEAYVDIEARIDGKIREISVPVNYRRTGLDADTRSDCENIIRAAIESFNSKDLTKWKGDAKRYWDSSNKRVTRPFFDALLGKLAQWVCQRCELPENPNFARRIQDIKEAGFTLSTETARRCTSCGQSASHYMLLPVPQGNAHGYETFSKVLRNRIMKVLKSYDAYEDSIRPSASLLPDHKFSEIRWSEDTREENPDDMAEERIREKFQLVTNQRNQQKREACRECFQTGIRGTPFGIDFYYEGGHKWPPNLPRQGREAEAGCVGCGWYDLKEWRESLNRILIKLREGRD